MPYTIATDTFTWSEAVRLMLYYRRETSDYNTCLSIIRDDEYQVGELGVVPGRLYLDVGCHVGAWACLVGKLGGRVKAYDPIPENASLAMRNAMLNGLDSVKVYPYAVTGRDGGSVRVYYSPMRDEFDEHHRFIGTKVPYHLAGDREYAEAPTVSLDAILADEAECQVMKIDCEGFEYEILKAASRETLGKINHIIGEYHAIADGEYGIDALLSCCRGVFNLSSSEVKRPGLGAFLLERVD